MIDDGDMIRSDPGLRTGGESAPVRVTTQDFKRAVDDTASERKERRKEMERQKTNSRRRCGSSLGTALGRCHLPPCALGICRLYLGLEYSVTRPR
jgi:hypothetical protein